MPPAGPVPPFADLSTGSGSALVDFFGLGLGEAFGVSAESLAAVSNDGYGVGWGGGWIAESGLSEALSTAVSDDSAVLGEDSPSGLPSLVSLPLLSALLGLSESSKEGFGGALGGGVMPASLALLAVAFSESEAFELGLRSCFEAAAGLVELPAALELEFVALAGLLSLVLALFSGFLVSASASASSTLNEGVGGAAGGAEMVPESGVPSDSFFSCFAVAVCSPLGLSVDAAGAPPSSFTSKLGVGAALGGGVMPPFKAPSSYPDAPSSFFVFDGVS